MLIAVTDGDACLGQRDRRFRLARGHAAAAGADRPLRERAEMGGPRAPIATAPIRATPSFTELAADFAAAIHGMPKEDLLSQEVREQRRSADAWPGRAAASLLVPRGPCRLAGESRDRRRALAIEQRNIAEQQRQLAQQQRDRAERSLDAARETANALIVQLAREFRDRAGMPRDLVRRILDRAHALQRQLVESGETAPRLRASEALALGELMDVLLALGDTKAALEAGERVRAIMEALVASDPGNTLWQRDLAVAYERMGGMLLAAGRREEALEDYSRSFAITYKLTTSNPGNTEWQRDLWLGNVRLGDVLATAGQRADALEEYRKGLAIIQKLAAADPRNTDWQRGLAISYSKIGDMLLAAGRHEEALDGISAEPHHSRTACRRRSRQHAVAARPVGQPQPDRRHIESGRPMGGSAGGIPNGPCHPRETRRQRSRQYALAARCGS